MIPLITSWFEWEHGVHPWSHILKQSKHHKTLRSNLTSSLQILRENRKRDGKFAKRKKCAAPDDIATSAYLSPWVSKANKFWTSTHAFLSLLNEKTAIFMARTFSKKQSSFAVESISLKGFCLNKISVMKMCSVTWNRFPINFWWLIQLCRLCGDYLNTDIYESLKLNHREDMKAEPVGWFLESLQKT